MERPPASMRSLPPEVPEGPRAEILEAVATTPGIHLRGVERAVDLPLGQVVYHLDRLQRMGMVNSQRDRGFRRFYTTGDVARGEKRWLAALRHETPRRIVLELLRQHGQSHKQLREAVGVAGSTLSFHLQRLVEAEILVRRRESGMVYEVADAGTLRSVLAEHHASFGDPALDAYVHAEGLTASRKLDVAEAETPRRLSTS